MKLDKLLDKKRLADMAWKKSNVQVTKKSEANKPKGKQ